MALSQSHFCWLPTVVCREKEERGLGSSALPKEDLHRVFPSGFSEEEAR